MSLVNDTFWNQRIKTVAENTLPSMHNVLKKTGRWDFFDFKWDKNDPSIEPHIFWDSDMAKFLEAVCYTLKYTDPKSEVYQKYLTWIDQIVKMAQKAQQPDGYLNSYFTQITPDERWKNVSEKHELYCCGHLLEAAVAHYEATGSKALVDVMCKYLDLICDTFGKEDHKMHGYPGHQEIELAIVKLLKIVPEPRYLELLDYFVEQRGYNNGEFYDQQARARGLDPDTYNPEGDYDHLPPEAGLDFESLWPEPRSYWYFQAESLIRDTKEVKGHSVRQVYYLTAVQALANMKNDESLKKAVRILFDNMIDKKFYIHGGIGAISRWEGFGENYDLRWDGYSETCASIGLILMCEKMLLNHLDRKVSLAMERALYNDVLGGVSITGDSYFYNQPITGKMGLERQKWFSVACCPPNVARLFNSLEKYSALALPSLVAIHLYIGIDIETENYRVKVVGDYPHSGKLRVQIKSQDPITFAIREPETEYQCSSNEYVVKDGYLVFTKKVWEDETIHLEFQVPVQVVEADPKVEANEGCVAVQRGPFVYALQKSGIDKKGVDVDDIVLSKNQQFECVPAKYHNAEYIALVTESNGCKLTFVPYYVTGNENPGEDFRIWIRNS